MKETWWLEIVTHSMKESEMLFLWYQFDTNIDTKCFLISEKMETEHVLFFFILNCECIITVIINYGNKYDD